MISREEYLAQAAKRYEDYVAEETALKEKEKKKKDAAAKELAAAMVSYGVNYIDGFKDIGDDELIEVVDSIKDTIIETTNIVNAIAEDFIGKDPCCNKSKINISDDDITRTFLNKL